MNALGLSYATLCGNRHCRQDKLSALIQCRCQEMTALLSSLTGIQIVSVTPGQLSLQLTISLYGEHTASYFKNVCNVSCIHQNIANLGHNLPQSIGTKHLLEPWSVRTAIYLEINIAVSPQCNEHIHASTSCRKDEARFDYSDTLTSSLPQVWKRGRLTTLQYGSVQRTTSWSA